MKNRLVWSVGINDADYPVQKEVTLEEILPSGRKKRKTTWKCPYHSKWKAMLDRCYSPLQQERNKSYNGVTVCEEWLTFSNFKAWMEQQDWEHKVLDKDIIKTGNKVYSPKDCVFVSTKVNMFIVDAKRKRGEHLLGCHWNIGRCKILAQCNNPFTRKTEHLGYFDCEIDGHLAWKKRKYELACQLADSEYTKDKTVAEALRNRYKNYTVVEDHLK